MSRLAPLAAFAIAVMAVPVSAQPMNTPEQESQAVPVYLYLMDAGKNKVLVSTQFWRNDPKYDDRAFRRFLDVLAALEKRGFRKDEKAVVDNWDKPQPFARCFVYLEDLQAGKQTKTTVTSGARVWCSGAGLSEAELQPSDNPKHIEQVLARFDSMLERAKKNVKK